MKIHVTDWYLHIQSREMQRRFVISYNIHIMNENDRERMRAFGRNDGLLDGHMP
jgi:uncharacterized protein affecting Mg2+/Co2+ transport